VLALFLAGTALTTACAAHDLAHAGIGSDFGFKGAATYPGDAPGNDAPSSGHAVSDCCHSGCHHGPAVLSIPVMIASVESSHAFLPADSPCPTAPVEPVLRPPIL